MASSSNSARAILITGGASGIGRAVVLHCARRGDNVAVADLNLEGAKDAAANALSEGAAGALALTCDVTDEGEVGAAFDAVSRRFGPLYGAFANAGIDRGGFIHDLPLSTWELVVKTNLTGVFLTCKYALRHMLSGKTGGSIVCTSSPTGFIGLAAGGAGAYSATKGAISTLVRCMAVDYARYGIRVNAIVPGATETPLMWANVPPEEIPSMRTQVSSEIPLGRLAQPEDPARAVAWLLSDEASYVTGSHLVCDGGILAKGSISV